MEVEVAKKTSKGIKAKIAPWIAKLKKIKNIEFILCLFIIAIALLLYNGLTKEDNADSIAVSTETVVSSEEARLAEILSDIEGAGEVSVMITHSGDEINGVLVVASGAKDIAVRLRLLEATKVALNVEADIVSVYASNKV